MRKKILMLLIFSALVFTFAAPEANAKGKEYKSVVKHLKTKYKAKKVKIPFMWLARFAVGVVRPAGVKSFSVTLFEDLKFSRETLTEEMKRAMKNSLSADWSPVFHVRSREGQQAFMYMRETGSSVRIFLVTIDKQQAAVIRATFNPEKLAEFINEPEIFGISLNDNQQGNNKNFESKGDTDPEENKEN